jgi:hypothetical protein
MENKLSCREEDRPQRGRSSQRDQFVPSALSSRAEQVVREANDAKSRDLLFYCALLMVYAARKKQVPPRAN